MRYARPLVFAAFASLSAVGALHCGGGAQTSIADGADGGDASPTDASTPPTDAPTGPTDSGPADVLQFGYFGNADSQIEVDLRGWQNLLDELHGRGNVVLMNYLSQEDLDNLRKSGIQVGANVNADDLLVAKMRAAKDRGFGSVLVLASVFFESGKLAQLRPDYKARWAHLKDVLTRNNLLDDVVAEYTLDEPYHNAKAQGVSAATMKGHLETINAFLATELPRAKRLLVEAYSSVGTDYQPPAGYAFIGLDCYGSFTRCGPEGVSIPNYIARLRARATGGEKIALIPDAFVFQAEKNADPNYRKRVANTAQEYIEYADAQSASIGAFIPFLFNISDEPGANPEGLVAANRMAEVTQVYERYFARKNLELGRKLVPLDFNLHVQYTAQDRTVVFGSTAMATDGILTIAPAAGSAIELSFARPLGAQFSRCTWTGPNGVTIDCTTTVFEKARVPADETPAGTWTVTATYDGVSTSRTLVVRKP